MGVRSISLPDELEKELDEAANNGNRGFSAEIRMRLERDRLANPTGVAEDRSVSTIKIGEVEGPVILTDAEKSGVATEDPAGFMNPIEYAHPEPGHGIKGLVIPVPFRRLAPGEKSTADRLKEKFPVGPVEEPSEKAGYRKHVVGKFSGVSELAKKIAKDVPGVKVAAQVDPVTDKSEGSKSAVMSFPVTGENLPKSRPEKPKFEVPPIPGFGVVQAPKKLMADEPRDGSLDMEGLTDKMRKSAKKRPEETTGNSSKTEPKFELKKGFWKEKFATEEAARKAAAGMGWKDDEFTIKPITP